LFIVLADVNSLLSSLRTFGTHATQFGAASLSHASPFTQASASNTLANFAKAKEKSSAELFQKKEQIRANAQAALMAVRTEMTIRESD
jgi:hypothetical protein